jgi:uncharacterized membrane protein HdeD (DUF308 family)
MVVLAGNWWAFVFRGVLAILFGILTFVMPGMTLLTLVFLFGFYAISDGVFNLIAAFRRGDRSDAQQQPWWALLIEGILSIIAGLLAFFMPGLTAMALVYLIAGWSLATGVMEIVAAVRLRRHITGEWVLVLGGVLSILFGLLIAIFPGAGALTIVIWIGAYAVVFGVLMVTLGLRLRKLVRTVERDAHVFPAGGPGPVPS